MYVAVPIADDRRSADRIDGERIAVLRFGAVVQEIEVLDLTAGGCRFTSDVDIPLFARVSIGMAGVGPLPAHVVWKGSSSYGCAFDVSLPPDAVTMSAPENVAHILTATRLRQSELEGDLGGCEKLPINVRVLIIGGLAAGLWSGIIAIARPLLALIV